jgi:hypothetical protein
MYSICPRCGRLVKQGDSRLALKWGGIVGILAHSVFSPFHCVHCGDIPLREFPTNVRIKKTAINSVALLAAFGFVVAVIAATVIYWS